MKTLSLIIVALGFISPLIAHGKTYTHREAIHQSQAFSPSGSLSISNINGSITIKTWDKPKILIEGEKRAKTDEELKQIQITYDLSSNEARIKVKLPRRKNSGWFSGNNIRANVSFTITVPETADLDSIKTINGALLITGTQGLVNASTVNGKINAVDLADDTRLRTINGSVHATFTTLPAEVELAVKTVNGSITISLPEGAGASFSGTVVNGRINSDIPLTIDSKLGGKHIRGTIGDGGASLNAKTVNGSIRIVRNSELGI